MVVAGDVSNRVQGFGDFGLARYNSDGSLDNSFGGDGRITTDFGQNDFASALGVQRDGKILAAGAADSPGGPYDFAVARYRAMSCTISGTPADDYLVGTSGADVICGGRGKDIIKGLEDRDFIRGEEGPDVLVGGTGNDALEGGPGTDTVDFSTSAAAISASLSNIWQSGTATGDGSDTLDSVENIVGSPGGDTLRGNGANNMLRGVPGSM
jgi:uncharacterized delta-60 repeat protein